MVLVGEFWSNPTLTGTEHGTTLLLLGFEKEEAMKKERALASSYCFVLEREIKIRVERERRAKPLSLLSTHSCTVLYGWTIEQYHIFLSSATWYSVRAFKIFNVRQFV